MMQMAIVLPPEVANAFNMSVAHAYDTLGHPTLAPTPSCGVTGSAAVL